MTFSEKPLLWAGAFFVFPLFLIFDYFAYLKNPSAISERARFIFWLHEYSDIKKYLLVSVVLMLLIGGIQLILQYVYGGMDPVFYRYGIVYENIASGELWRFFFGSIFHYSLVHYIVNFTMFVPVFSVTTTMVGKKSMLIFLFANTFGATAQYYFGAHEPESCAGISFGIYGLLGYLSGSGFNTNKELSKGLGLLFFGIAVSGICIMEVTSKTAATAGHIGGLMIGVSISILFFLFSNKPKS